MVVTLLLVLPLLMHLPSDVVVRIDESTCENENQFATHTRARLRMISPKSAVGLFILVNVFFYFLIEIKAENTAVCE
jgi:hypothetical protein